MKYFYLLFALFVVNFAHSQDRSICPDVEGAINHPMLDRYKNSCIVAYTESKFNAVTFPISKINSSDGSEKEITAEGKVVNIIYGIENSERATVLEVFRNYEQALKDSKFEILFSAFGRKNISGSYKIQSTYEAFGSPRVLQEYEHQKSKSYFRFSLSHQAKNINEDDAYFVAQGKHEGKIYTMAIFIHYNRTSSEGLTNNIFVQAQIVEQEDMETGQVSAASIEEQIKNEGKEVFHNILFDFGSENLTTESFETIEILANYLKANSSKKFYIVGHTDNVGDLSSNQILSEKRAKSVLNALINKYGVNASQISAHGVGQLSPLSANETEEGMALNRRVEVVLE